jgi:hypothetical protein
MRDWNRKNPRADKRQKLKKFGLGLSDYDQMLEQQGGLCAICGREETQINTKTDKPFSLAVDHCHKTGAVRGLLCMKCNRGLGLFEDNIEVLKKALAYLGA